jgi:NTE family protein
MYGGGIRGLRAVFCVLALTGIGCAGARVVNEPLERDFSQTYGYSLANPEVEHDVGKLQFYLMFSGGGTRAAALAYGVLKELAATTITVRGEKIRLLDEIDMISSVSGGSFTAAYYGLHGEGIFDSFEEVFLKRNVDRDLALGFVRPFIWMRMLLTSYDRADWAEHVYDEHVFHGATFADLIESKGPIIRINATDLAAGHPFTFVQPQFNIICSDLTPLSISRAVLASSSVPVVFAPTVVENYAGTCGYTESDEMKEALSDRHKSRRRYRLAKEEAEYLDSGAHKYIYLIDGGVSDNLGVRGFLDQVIVEGGMADFAAEAGIDLPPDALIVAVNAQAVAERTFQVKLDLPSMSTVLGAISGAGMYRYNFETIELLQDSVERWMSDGGAGGEAVVVEVAFDNLSDPDERRFFNNVETSFNLDEEQVDRLIEVGGRLLRESPEFADFIEAVR